MKFTGTHDSSESPHELEFEWAGKYLARLAYPENTREEAQKREGFIEARKVAAIRRIPYSAPLSLLEVRSRYSKVEYRQAEARLKKAFSIIHNQRLFAAHVAFCFAGQRHLAEEDAVSLKWDTVTSIINRIVDIRNSAAGTTKKRGWEAQQASFRSRAWAKTRPALHLALGLYSFLQYPFTPEMPQEEFLLALCFSFGWVSAATHIAAACQPAIPAVFPTIKRGSLIPIEKIMPTSLRGCLPIIEPSDFQSLEHLRNTSLAGKAELYLKTTAFLAGIPEICKNNPPAS